MAVVRHPLPFTSSPDLPEEPRTRSVKSGVSTSRVARDQDTLSCSRGSPLSNLPTACSLVLSSSHGAPGCQRQRLRAAESAARRQVGAPVAPGEPSRIFRGGGSSYAKRPIRTRFSWHGEHPRRQAARRQCRAPAAPVCVVLDRDFVLTHRTERSLSGDGYASTVRAPSEGIERLANPTTYDRPPPRPTRTCD